MDPFVGHFVRPRARRPVLAFGPVTWQDRIHPWAGLANLRFTTGCRATVDRVRPDRNHRL